MEIRLEPRQLRLFIAILALLMLVGLGLTGRLKPDTRTTAKPWGSPTQTTPPEARRLDWLIWVKRNGRDGNVRNGRKRKATVSAAQLSLF